MGVGREGERERERGRVCSYFACLAHIRSAKWPDLVHDSVCRKETFALARGFSLEAAVCVRGGGNPCEKKRVSEAD